jgi:hypothetical protein
MGISGERVGDISLQNAEKGIPVKAHAQWHEAPPSQLGAVQPLSSPQQSSSWICKQGTKLPPIRMSSDREIKPRNKDERSDFIMPYTHDRQKHSH